MSLNWTKVGLKDAGRLRHETCIRRLNWTKVGLKALIRISARGQAREFELD